MPERRFAVVESVFRSGDLETDLEWAGSAGVAGIGLDGSAISRHRGDEVAAMLAGRGLIATSLDGLPGAIDLRTGIEQAEKRLHWCAQVRSPVVNGHPGPLLGRSFSQADLEVRAALEVVGPLASQMGLTVAIEPVHPVLSAVTFVHSLRHAFELIADIPGVGITFDVAHLFWDRHVYEDLTQAVPKIATVQIADVDPDALADYCYARCQLGQGVVPLEQMLLSLDDAGYRGFYEFESVRSMPKSERVDFVRTAREWFEGFWEQRGQTPAEGAGT
jgi:sugar phosphate isomerase/epimerase